MVEAHHDSLEMLMSYTSTTRRIAFAATALLLAANPSVAMAGQGYRGSSVNGCQAYIQDDQAWTNCHPSTASGELKTHALCTAEPSTSGPWVYIGANSTVYGLSYAECTFNVHRAQVHWQ